MKKLLLLPIITTTIFATNLDNLILDLNNKQYNKVINTLKNKQLDKQSAFILGEAYFKRHLTYTDYKLAMKYFQFASTPKSFYYIGLMYEKGLGVQPNINEAIKYFEKSNTKEANYELGRLYLEGVYVLKSPKKAIKLLEKSAKAGYDKAQLLLGKLYLFRSDIVEPSLSQAAKWIYLSYHNGNLEAKYLWNKYQLYKYLKA